MIRLIVVTLFFIISYGISASHDTRANRAPCAGRYDHAGSRWLRSGQDPHQWRMRGKNDRPPDPSRSPPLRAMAGKHVRTV
jgi:hypothetical protein